VHLTYPLLEEREMEKIVAKMPLSPKGEKEKNFAKIEKKIV